MQSDALTLSHVPAEWASPPAQMGRGPKAAREFEAYLIGSLLQSLQKTFCFATDENASPGAEDYSYMGTQALARALSEQGGFGIAAMISQHLPEQTKVTDASGIFAEEALGIRPKV